MTILSPGRPLTEALPDLDDLLSDPAAYLRDAPLAFGPPRVGRLIALLIGPGVAVLAARWLDGRSDWLRLGVGVGLVAAGLLWLLWSLRLRGRELLLRADGVEVVSGARSVFAPWALFHAASRSMSRDAGGVVVPINPAAADVIEQRRSGRVEASGRRAAVAGWGLIGWDEARLAGPYEVAAADLGELLQLLGRRLGQELPTPARTEPFDVSGWFVVPAARLRLPPCCASCGGPPDDVIRVRAAARGDALLGVAAERPVVAIPVCAACRRRLERRQRSGGAIGLGVGAMAGALVGGPVGLALGAAGGALAGFALSRRLPVRLRRYSPSRGVVSVRFENADVAAHVLEELRRDSQEPRTEGRFGPE